MNNFDRGDLPQRPLPKQAFVVDALGVELHVDRPSMGRAAGIDVANRIKEIIAAKGTATIVLAAAPSQNEFLATLREQPGIDWEKVIAFHLDEYVGLSADAPQSFRSYLRHAILDQVKPGVVHLIRGESADPEAECERYSELLRQTPPDVACLGIGENGHIAFNDPPVADFDDPLLMKIVELEERCRVQQVHDGCFSRLEDVPRRAFTMTIPEVMAAGYLYTIVPAATKAEAVRDTLEGPISTACPASILRTHPRAMLYLDPDSASLLEGTRL